MISSVSDGKTGRIRKILKTDYRILQKLSGSKLRVKVTFVLRLYAVISAVRQYLRKY